SVDVSSVESTCLSPHVIQLDGEIMRSKNYVIATDSRATIPKICGIETVKFLTNETIFDELSAKPESMIILGGGPIGCELAQTFCRLGVHVTILQRGDQLLPKEDRDVAHFLERRLVGEGVRMGKNADSLATAASRAG